MVHYSVLLMLNAWVRDFSLFGWSLLNLFASLHFTLSMISTCASKILKPVLPHESTISTYMRYSFAILSKFACAISNFQNKLLFCVFVSLTEQWGWLIFSMLDVLFSRWVFIHLSLHESKAKVLGMPSPEMQKWIYFMLSNNKFLGKCWYGRQPWIRLAMESESMVEKGIDFIFCLGTAYDISSMESVGNCSVIFVDRKSMPLKKNYLSI